MHFVISLELIFLSSEFFQACCLSSDASFTKNCAICGVRLEFQKRGCRCIVVVVVVLIYVQGVPVKLVARDLPKGIGTC
jgi:hypothetical protein